MHSLTYSFLNLFLISNYIDMEDSKEKRKRKIEKKKEKRKEKKEEKRI